MQQGDRVENFAMDDSDHALIKATGTGDHLAFELLVRRYQHAVVNFIFHCIGDRSTAEDIAQEVFIRVYDGASGFEPRAKLATWIFKIARNLCLNELKRRSRRKRCYDSLSSQLTESGSSPFSSVFEGLESAQELMCALETLPENQRAALLLRVNEGLPYAEIAKVLSVSVASVESLIFRARTRLRETLGKQQEV